MTSTMNGRLSDSDMDQLETWIGTGSKVFTLLYTIAKDGCDSAVFHQKCDNQGPTVTVLYNQHGSVYGGYTSESWNTNGQWLKDDKAFLYQLRFSGTNTFNMFPVKDTTHTVHGGQSYGPLFGSGNDLRTFTNKIATKDGRFPLNGYMTFSKSFDNKGIASDNINNGTMEVTDLEVYKVTDGRRTKILPKPWRETPELNNKSLTKLVEEIESFKPLSDVDLAEFRVMLLGPVGSGKSSFYNTINSVFRGRITQRAICGNSVHSTTTTLTPYSIRTQKGTTLHFRLCDTRGLEETQGPDILECNYLLDGHIPDFYKFNPSSHITLNSPEFILKPPLKNKVHCAVFVIDASTTGDLSAKMLDKMTSFRTLMNEKGIPQAALLTKIDKISKDIDETVSNTFKSDDVKQKVDEVSQMLGVPRSNVLPVKNYENQMQLDDGTSVLALLALRQMLYFAEDHTENLLLQMQAGLSMTAQARGNAAEDDTEVRESDTA